MAEGADVIELGSSDEEPEPAPKKPKQLNAMVTIPDNLPNLTIKKKSSAPQATKVRVSPSVQNLLKNPFATKSIQTVKKAMNGKLQREQRIVMRKAVNIPINQKNNVRVENCNRESTSQKIKVVRPNVIPKNVTCVNKPLKFAPNFTLAANAKSQVTAADMSAARNIIQGIHSGNPQYRSIKIPVNVGGNIRPPMMMPRIVGSQIRMLSAAARPPPAKGQKSLTNLPPGITVKRVSEQEKKRKGRRPPSPAKVTFKKQKLASGAASDVPTVELDDEDDEAPSQPTTASPQWYVRPEDANMPTQLEPEPNVTVEAKNNAEPEEAGKQMIEITIDDSPIKPPLITTAGKMISDLSIIIEDSPKKGKGDVQAEVDKSSSDEERTEPLRTPHSKKKLNFPKDTLSADLIEVEVEFDNPIHDSITEVIGNDTSQSKESVELPITVTDDLSSPRLSKNKESKIPRKVIECESSQSKEENVRLHTNKKDAPQKSSNDKESQEYSSMNVRNVLPASSNIESKTVSTKCKDPDSILCTSKRNDCSSPTTSKNKDRTNTTSDHVSPSISNEHDSLPSSRSKTQDPSPSSKSKVQDSLPTNVKSQDPLPCTSSIKDCVEFDETYQEFISTCLEMENSEDMKKIVEKKVKEYYRQVDKNYTESVGFKEFVASKIEDMKRSPENLYLYIKDIVDELKIKRKHKGKPEVKEKAVEKPKTKEMDDAEISDLSNESKGTDRKTRNIRKLEKTLRKLHRAIQKLEEEEVDFDDDTESVYLLTESEGGLSSRARENPRETDRQIQITRYKERLVRVHAKLCQLTSTKMPSEPRVTLEPRLGKPIGPTLKLEQWINKRVPAGAPLPFPDFHDVVRCVREANDEDKLGWSEMEIMEEARDLFSRCGRKLQKRRQKNEWRIAASRIAESSDPAEESQELRVKLEQNKKIAAKKETDVINKYADRQLLLKLEGKELGENELEESAPSSDDDVQAIEDDTNNKVEKAVSPSKGKDEELKCQTPQIKIVEVVSMKETEIIADSTEITEPEKVLAKAEEINDDEEIKGDVVTVEMVKENGDCESFKDAEVMEVDSEPGVETLDAAKQDVASNIETEVQSDSENIQLVFSDDSNGTKSGGSEPTHKQNSEVEVASSLTSSDADAPIAISDTQDSNDNRDHIIKVSGDVVSIENSSYSDSDRNDVNCSPPSKEKQSLLDIDDTDDDSRNVETETEIEATSLDHFVEDTECASERIKNMSDPLSDTLIPDLEFFLPDNICGYNNTQTPTSRSSYEMAETHNENNSKSVSDDDIIESKVCSDDGEIIPDLEEPQVMNAEKRLPRPISIDDDSSYDNENAEAFESTIIQGDDILASSYKVSQTKTIDISALEESEILIDRSQRHEKVLNVKETLEIDYEEPCLSPDTAEPATLGNMENDNITEESQLLETFTCPDVRTTAIEANSNSLEITEQHKLLETKLISKSAGKDETATLIELETALNEASDMATSGESARQDETAALIELTELNTALNKASDMATSEESTGIDKTSTLTELETSLNEASDMPTSGESTGKDKTVTLTEIETALNEASDMPTSGESTEKDKTATLTELETALNEASDMPTSGESTGKDKTATLTELETALNETSGMATSGDNSSELVGRASDPNTSNEASPNKRKDDKMDVDLPDVPMVSCLKNTATTVVSDIALAGD